MTHFKSSNPELDVLAPLPNALLTVAEENNWPDFKLNNVQVQDQQGNLVNLFSASTENLLDLFGTLKTDGLQDKLYCIFKLHCM
jgi:hypothetical protein